MKRAVYNSPFFMEFFDRFRSIYLIIMTEGFIYLIGFLAQALFGARLISQWFLSERSKKVETPSFYWQLSLFGSILMFMYGYLRQDLPIMMGQVFIYLIYIRNLQLQDQWKDENPFLKFIYVGAPVLIALYLFIIPGLQWTYLLEENIFILGILGFGILGQFVFHSRFIYQWIYSERNRESSLPKGFWILSLFGAMLIFTYGILRRDPVLIISHFFGSIVYVRNMTLLKNVRV